jgi:hypothetical protein
MRYLLIIMWAVLLGCVIYGLSDVITDPFILAHVGVATAIFGLASMRIFYLIQKNHNELQKSFYDPIEDLS